MLAIVGFVIAAAMIASGAAMLTSRHSTQRPHLKDMKGNTVTFDPGTLPSKSAEKRMKPTPQIHDDRLNIPSVGLDVPLGAMDAVDNVITPPTFTSAYWVRNIGVPPQSAGNGTVFVAMHSLRGGGVGPGNYLYDTATGKARVATGAVIHLDGITYTVTGTETIPKPRIGDDQDLWQNTRNRLVLITCLERPGGGPSYDNFIVTARRNETS